MKIRQSAIEKYLFYLRCRNFLKREKCTIKAHGCISGFEAFWKYDSHGKKIATRHPRLVAALKKGMENVNMMIQMYAEEMLPKNQGSIHFRELNLALRDMRWPLWARRAIATSYKKYRIKFYANLCPTNSMAPRGGNVIYGFCRICGGRMEKEKQMTTPLTWTPHPDGSETAEALGFKYEIRLHLTLKYATIVTSEGIRFSTHIADSEMGRQLCQSHHDAILKAVVSDPVREHMEAVLVIIKGGGFPLGTIDQLIEKVLAAYAKHKEQNGQ